MKNDFLCPQCKGHLRPSNKIILSVKNHKGDTGLMLLSTELGKYSVVNHSSLELVAGEHLDVFCPICSADLGDLYEHADLARILMVDNDGHECDIIFSEIVGQKCTYKIYNGKMESFGEDADEYTNFWGETPRY